MSLRINSSNVAALLGRHAYASQSDALLAAWKASDRESYIAAHHRLGVETPEERKQRIRDYYPALDILAQTSKPSRLSTNSLLNRDDIWGTPRFLDEDATDTRGRRHVSRMEAINVAMETANTGHGIDREHRVLLHANDILGRHFQACDTLYAKSLGTTGSGRPVVLQGRVDAIETGTPPVVLEIKTRARGLKMSVPEYERIQVDAYIYLTDASYAFLVEAYYPSKRPETVPDINVSRVDRSEERLERLVAGTLRTGRVVEHLLDDTQFQDTFIRSTSRDKLVAEWMEAGH